MKFVSKWMNLVCLLVLIATVFLAVGCGAKQPVTANTPAATETTLHKLTVAAYEIANAENSGEQEFEALYAAGIPGVNDDGYAKTVTALFLNAEGCTKTYIAQLQSLTTVDDSSKAQVIGWTNALTSCANNLVTSGAVGIKDPATQQKIQQYLAPIPAAVSLIETILGIQQAAPSAPAQTTSMLIFTEVNFGSTVRSESHSTGHSVARQSLPVPGAAQNCSWPFRSGPVERGREFERWSYREDAGIPGQIERRSRWIINPSRESWLRT